MPAAAEDVVRLCRVLLQLVDKFGNDVEKGEVRVDAKAFGPKASECNVEDKQDGTYKIIFTAGVPGDYRVQVRLENMEMTPLTVKVESRDLPEGTDPPPACTLPSAHTRSGPPSFFGCGPGCRSVPSYRPWPAP